MTEAGGAKAEKSRYAAETIHRKRHPTLRTALLAASIAAATLIVVPATAQEAVPEVPADVAAPVADQGGDFYVVGLGAGVLPDYEGSDDYSLSPVPGAAGRVSGFNFLLAGNRASVDLIPDGVGPTWDFQAGPIAVLNLNRSTLKSIDEVQVRALGKRDAAIELGGYVGIGKTGVLTSDFDRLSFSLSYRKGVTGAHDAGLLVPTVNYTTPLSTKALAGVFVSAERAERDYGRAYFDVDAAGSLASGLPQFRTRGGWKNWTVGALAARSITGDLTGGLQAVGGVVYRRMLNDFGDSPLTADLGSRNQWLGTIGLAYSF